MSCGLENPDGNLLCLAHSNRLQDGKGMGLKSKDEAGAICCDRCHSLIDGRTKAGLDRLQRQDMHEQANRRTVAWWRKNGYLPANLETTQTNA
jgi:hypothetical protein